MEENEKKSGHNPLMTAMEEKEKKLARNPLMALIWFDSSM